jgi:hypothetical protein
VLVKQDDDTYNQDTNACSEDDFNWRFHGLIVAEISLRLAVSRQTDELS